jgi:hypothetical protein
MERQRHMQSEGDETTVGAQWFKSSYSSPNGNCVELAVLGDGVGLRDSKDRSGPVLRFTPSEWEAFVSGVRDGEFDI